MLLHGRDLSPEAAKARREAEVRGGRKEGLNRTNRTAVEDAEGHARAAPTAAVGGGRSDGEGRDWPRPLRALPPASGARRSDTGRGLLRTDASASRRDPARRKRVTSRDSTRAPGLIDCNELLVESVFAVFEFSAT